MSDFIKTLGGYITDFVKFLFLHIIKVLSGLYKAKDGIPVKELVLDIFSVVQKTGFFFLLNMTALFVFTSLPQGKDVILIISEEVGVEHRFGSLIWMLIGVLFWSIVSEFACRYSVYVADNSGKSISQERVEWKKQLQNATAEIALMMPFFIMLMAFLINYLTNDTLKDNQIKWGFGIPAILLYLMLNAVV
ncbi:MAG: hypothetical protein K0S12_780, partial [Bacteroidetes bacterium]|nr:hypothetical protein [Bacteroidota bacterium]